MTHKTLKGFHCVESMRAIRDSISAEVSGMSQAELVTWARSQAPKDSSLRRLWEKRGGEKNSKAAPRKRP